MNFELGILYESMEELIVKCSKKISNYVITYLIQSNITRMNFFEVLNLLTKHSEFRARMNELKVNSLSILFALLVNGMINIGKFTALKEKWIG